MVKEKQYGKYIQAWFSDESWQRIKNLSDKCETGHTTLINNIVRAVLKLPHDTFLLDRLREQLGKIKKTKEK